jgi:uncharacterized protein (TIGR02246 family)
MKHIKTYNKVNEGKLTEASFKPGDKFGGQDGDKDYKYKKYVSKAFAEINGAMFNFRNAMGVKQLGQADKKLKNKLDSLHQAIFDLQKEMKSDGLTEGKIYEGNDFNMVSAKFKDALDDASIISTASVKKLIKKYKEKRPDAAMAYAKQAFGWMFKEGKLNEGKVSKKDKKIIEDLLNDPNAKLSTIEKGIIKKLISEGKLTEGTYIDLRIVNENVTDEIEGALSHWLNTLADGDAVQMSDLYLDNGILLGTVAPEILQGRLQIQEYFEMFLGKNPIGSIDTFILQNFGDICVADGTYTFELDGEGGRQSVAARYTYVWKKENDKWMIATHHSSVNPK